MKKQDLSTDSPYDNEFCKNVKFHRDRLQTRGNIVHVTIPKLQFLQRNVWQAGSVCLPVICFLVKNMNFKLFYFLQLAVELHETSTFLLNLVWLIFIYRPYVSSDSILKISGCFENELFSITTLMPSLSSRVSEMSELRSGEASKI